MQGVGLWNRDQCQKDKSNDYDWNRKTEGDEAVYDVEQGAFGAGDTF